MNLDCNFKPPKRSQHQRLMSAAAPNKQLVVLLLPLNGQHHYVDDSVVRRLSRAGNWWVRDRDHHSGYTFTPCVGSFTSPGIDTR